MTVVPQGPLIYLNVWPAGQSQPNTSVTNSYTGTVVANSVLMGAGAGGAVSVFAYSNSPTDVIIDINGYFLTQSNTATQTTAFGSGASTTGNQNTAIGYNALQKNSSGNSNTATGMNALAANLTGNNNAALGSYALSFNTSGAGNTAVGTEALLSNTVGNDNVAIGLAALWANQTGSDNDALGLDSLYNNTVGTYNAAFGEASLYSNTTGSWNIALGYHAGYQVTTGSNNIEIGNTGTSTDSNVIRIGTQGTHLDTYIAGISGSTMTGGSMVLVNSNGQLGTISSSERYKQDIEDMGSASDRLMLLRPVTFRYKQPAEDGSRPLQYGLIGEEVANVYPELVVYGSDGQVQSVAYQELPAMLLNELQKQQRTIESLEKRVASLEAKTSQEKRLSDAAPKN